MKHKSYGETKVIDEMWADKLPSSWTLKPVKYLFDIGRGRVIAESGIGGGGEYPVYSSQTLNDGCMGFIDSYDYDCNQLTWTTDGANAGTVFMRKGKHNCTNVCGTLLPREMVQLNLKYYLYTLGLIAQYHKRPDTNGAKIMNGEMAIIRLPYPSLIEQVCIARFLDRETIKLDTLISKQEHLIELLQEKRQAIISHAVTKGLNPDAKMKDSNVEWLGMVPEHWNVRRLKFNLGLLNEKTDRRDFSIGLENIEGWSGKFIKTETEFDGEGIAFNIGDILFGKLRPYLAKVYLAEFSGEAVGDFHVMRPRDSVVGRFAQYQMLNREFISIVDGSTFGAKMPRASWDFVGGMMVTTPPESEQESIATYLDNQAAKIDTLINKAKRSIELAKEHRTALISAAVTGKIDVRNTSDNLETA